MLRELSRDWNGPPVTLRLIGSTALMLQSREFSRRTTDSDVLETSDLAGPVRAQLLALAGPDTPLAARWRIHLQLVPRGLPFLPHAPMWHEVPIVGLGSLIRVEALDIVDVLVSKLKRFNAKDRSDIDAMIHRITHESLRDRFAAALDRFCFDARQDDLPSYIANLNQVERDMFGVAESQFELPDWVDDGS
ncbi:MAG: hypothetical protein K1X94_25420 [Sandaracinaceae bacterium]|nr:hypothetical protein [Sandaracinaceae bacterium]